MVGRCEISDLVYHKNRPISHAGRRIGAKLMHRYKGPFEVDGFLTPVTVRLVDPVSGRFVSCANVSLLKSSEARSDQKCLSPVVRLDVYARIFICKAVCLRDTSLHVFIFR
jgi:hypothetical protein